MFWTPVDFIENTCSKSSGIVICLPSLVGGGGGEADPPQCWKGEGESPHLELSLLMLY